MLIIILVPTMLVILLIILLASLFILMMLYINLRYREEKIEEKYSDLVNNIKLKDNIITMLNNEIKKEENNET